MTSELTPRGVVTYLNHPETRVTQEQFDTICEYLLGLPEEESWPVFVALVTYGVAPRTNDYSIRFLLWRSPDGIVAGPIARKMEAYCSKHRDLVPLMRERARELVANSH